MVHPESASSIYCLALPPTQPLTLCPRAGGSGCSKPFTSEGYTAPGVQLGFQPKPGEVEARRGWDRKEVLGPF